LIVRLVMPVLSAVPAASAPTAASSATSAAAATRLNLLLMPFALLRAKMTLTGTSCRAVDLRYRR